MATPRKGFTKYKVASHTYTHTELPGSEKVRIATLAVIAAAKGRSLALSKADQRALAAMAIVDAADIVAHPEREAEIRARVERVTLEMVMAARVARSGRRAA